MTNDPNDEEPHGELTVELATRLAEQILKMHSPSSHRVPIPGIFQDAPACQECGKAHPCPTAEAAVRYTPDQEITA